MRCAREHLSLHQSLVQVFGAVGRPDNDICTLKNASAKTDRRTSKSATTTTSGGKTVNKSCDACSTKKRRCDGGRPCSRCVRRGDGHKCTYSTRRPYTSRKRRYRLWSLSTSSSEQEAVGSVSTARGEPCRKTSMDTHCRDNNRDQQTTSVVEALPPAAPMATPKSECPSPSIKEVYAELARAQHGVMSLIVSTNSLPLQGSNNGLEQQTKMMKRHPASSLGNADLQLGADVGVRYVETMPRTVSPEEESNPRSSDFPELKIDHPVAASSAALVSDDSTTDDDDGDSYFDLNIPRKLSDDVVTVHDVATISFDQHLPPTGENIADITAPVVTAVSLVNTFSALGQEEEDIISAEDWFEFAANL